MSKRKSSGSKNKPQRCYDKIQQDRQARADSKAAKAESLVASDQLGPKQNGQIIAHYGANLDVEDESGHIHHCLTRRNLPRLVCGDNVIWQTAGDDTGVIVEQLPRKTLLARPDYTAQLKPVAANIDQILVVTATIPNFDEDLINRYLIAAHLTDIKPVIVLNKIDLLTESQLTDLKQRLTIYSDLDYQIIFASTRQRDGLDQLYKQLKDHTSIFVGQSGVGKSSLIKQFLPEDDIRIGEISKATGLGKHTTTVTVLYRLDDIGSIIDSPGVREFGLDHVSQQRIASGFKEFEPFIGQCKFNDCSHHNEPDCAIQQAVKDGRISRSRFDSYHRIVKSLSRP